MKNEFSISVHLPVLIYFLGKEISPVATGDQDSVLDLQAFEKA